MLHAMLVLILEYSAVVAVEQRARILPKGVVGIFRAIRTHPIGAQLDVDVQLFMQCSRPSNALTT